MTDTKNKDENQVNTPDVYLLVHSHKDGETNNIVHYHPTDDAPYLDVEQAAKLLLGGLYAPELGECLQLIAVDADPDLTLFASDGVGTRVFREFYEGKLTI